MNKNNQESSKELSSGLIAIALSGFGIILLLMTLALHIRTQELKDLTFLVFGLFFIFWIYFGYKAVVSETPKWSENAKRLNGIGSAVMLAGGGIGINSVYLELGILMILAGLILILTAALYPSSRVRENTPIREEGGAEGEI